MRALVALLAWFLALAGGAARADTPIALFKSIAGNVNFVGTQKTMRTKANGNASSACAVTAAGTTISATLSGIPASATILSAQLYWAGSSNTADNTVTFEGASVTAPASRQYFSKTVGSGSDYFGGAVDVTAQVIAKRNGTYSFSDLTIKNGAPYCAVEGVVGGFALLAVYSDPDEQFRVLNIYEGFQFIRYGRVTLTLSNFRMPNPLGTATGRIGHITWEGDKSIGQNGEDLFFNGYQMSDGLNPKQNQFNSASNINNDDASHGIDFDAYTLDDKKFTAGQTSIATRYQSGQDLVLLNAEIISVPNVPTADLWIVMTRNSVLTQNDYATYTLSVGNGGPKVETGPVVVTTTLPVGFTFESASGSGWTCGASGQVVTCSNSSALAVGAKLPPITLTVLVAGGGTLTNKATVAGQLFDNNSANNVASDTSTVVSPPYAFTHSPCVSGKAFGSDQQTCKPLSGIPIVAGEVVPLYVTNLASGVPTTPNGAANTTVKMNFAISCINPDTNAGISANFAGFPLPYCTPNGNAPGTDSWSGPVNMLFNAGDASVLVNPSFTYNDVGKIQLYLRDDSSRIASSVPFVVKPARLALTAVIRNAGNVTNPGATTGDGKGFARVGEPFTVTAVALTALGTVAKNFGKEGARPVLELSAGGDAKVKAAMVKLPELAGDFTSVTQGVFTGSAFAVDDAGIVILTPLMENNDYLDAGPPAGAPTKATVGRFYPDHFDTTTTVTIGCLPHMACPGPVNGAAYSGQGFGVTVKPMGATGTELLNYNGVLAREITLGAYNAAGGAGANPGAGALAANTIAAASIAAGATIGLVPVYSLPQPFSSAAPRARNWTAPTPIYLRASASEDTAGGDFTVTSLRAVADQSVEGGVTIVSGRLALDNPHGSELMKMPVRAEAQYWTAGGRWETSARDNASLVRSGGIGFANCRGALAKTCTTALGVTADVGQALVKGVTTFWLKAPGAGNHGSAEFLMNNPPWLPSTTGRAVFGVYKSPLIYLREVY
jgi:MSHA biogenesis protein MshQ